MSVLIAMQSSAVSFSLEMLSLVFNLHLLVRFLLICKLLYKNIVLIVHFTVSVIPVIIIIFSKLTDFWLIL